jgi:hypothetical protein
MNDADYRIALSVVRAHDAAQDLPRRMIHNRQADGAIASGTRPAELPGRHVLRAMAGEPPDRLQTLLMPNLVECNDDRPQPDESN